MKSKSSVWLRFEWVIIVLIVLSFFLSWINWGKLHYLGIDIPFMYRKTTNISNTILFFLKKDSPHLAFYIFAVPILSVLSTLFIFRKKYKAANAILLITSILGFCLSLYMYYYFISSKLFKLKNAGVGIHLLCAISFIGIFYSIIVLSRKRSENISVIEEKNDNSESNKCR